MYKMEEIPMEEPYRQQLLKNYQGPRRKNTIMIGIIFLGFSILLFQNILFESVNYAILLLFLPLVVFCYLFYKKLEQYKIHYLKDAMFGFIIKEQTTITKVFETPAGINIYWLDCDAIKTFTPDPYRYFNEGDQVVIYYLKYSKEYLAYEMPGR
jgi:hypothetical protein